MSAQRRHPRRLATTAGRFRADALRARGLALAAFAEYAIVGREWALSGQARLRKRRAAAIRYAALAKKHALKGGRLLTAAGALLG